MCDEIIYPFPNFNGAAVEVWECISNFIPHFMKDIIDKPYWFKRIHFSKMGPWNLCYFSEIQIHI